MSEADILSAISDVEIIARGKGVRIRQYLNQKHGRGRWRKLKGRAVISDDFGRPRLAEIHWFEAHGIGRRDFKRKRWLED